MSYLLHKLILIKQFHIIYSTDISNASNDFSPNLGGSGKEKVAGREQSSPGQESSPEASGQLTVD